MPFGGDDLLFSDGVVADGIELLVLSGGGVRGVSGLWLHARCRAVPVYRRRNGGEAIVVSE